MQIKKKVKELYIENDFLSALIIVNSFLLLRMIVNHYMPILDYNRIPSLLRIIIIYSVGYFSCGFVSAHLKKYTIKPLVKATIHLILLVLGILML